MTKVTVLEVGMTCGGCSGAVTRILNKVEGVSDVKCDLETKKVDVTHDDSLDAATILSYLEKWSEASGKYVKLA